MLEYKADSKCQGSRLIFHFDQGKRSEYMIYVWCHEFSTRKKLNLLAGGK